MLELRAVCLTLLHLEQIFSQTVLIESDNTATVWYINKQEGVTPTPGSSPTWHQQVGTLPVAKPSGPNRVALQFADSTAPVSDVGQAPGGPLRLSPKP